MDNGSCMPKVNLETDNHKLTNIEKEYMKRVQEQNLARIQRWTKIRRKNRYVGFGLAVGVISIYSYTVWAIKQEKFLDDFNQPEKVID